jgi:hypothetical protein
MLMVHYIRTLEDEPQDLKGRKNTPKREAGGEAYAS